VLNYKKLYQIYNIKDIISEVMMDEVSNNQIDRRQLRERVLDRLRALILNGELRPGEFIRQQHIAKLFGVSQMPVREALKELAAEGLVENIPYRGVRVVQYSFDDIDDLFALRSFLEGRTAKAGASRITEEEVDCLVALAEKMKVAIASKQEAVYRSINRQFHQTIYRISGSYFLIQTLDKLWSTYPTMLPGNLSQTIIQPITSGNERDNEEHFAIIEALKKHDSEKVENLMKDHIQNAGNELITVYQEHQ
jgi:DNA-binding GntR family transcriptional regulator